MTNLNTELQATFQLAKFDAIFHVADKEWQGRGIGRTLGSAARRWAQDRGCVRLSVTSAERRADAHAFYPSCGLPYTGRRFSAAIASPGS